MSHNNKKTTTAIAAAIDEIWDDIVNQSLELPDEELARYMASNPTKVTPEGTHHDHIVLEDLAVVAVQSNNLTENSTEYKVGDYCRATCGDIDYEAKIISINQYDGTCLLKYIGYDTEQEVMLSSLEQSWGEEARSIQFAKAKVERLADAQNLPKVSAMGKDAQERNKLLESNINIPPPPPLPPMLSAVNNGEDSEHLSAMLMSWYLSGYYTGVYHAVQMAKCPNECKE